MEITELIEKRIRAKREILFSREDYFLDPLRAEIEQAFQVAVVCWALELAQHSAQILHRKYPEDSRAADAIRLTWLWARGKIKMPEAKNAILACHKAAKDYADPSSAARFHAIGQACGTVHAKGHALGYPIYELTAQIREEGRKNCDAAVAERVLYYIQLLQWHEAHCASDTGEWAGFLRNNSLRG